MAVTISRVNRSPNPGWSGESSDFSRSVLIADERERFDLA